MDYSLLKRDVVSHERLDELPEWDLFLSAYNTSERVTSLFERVVAARKEWLIHPEYEFAKGEWPSTGVVRVIETRDEAEFLNKWLDEADLDNFPPDCRIAVDITGFMRPHLMLLPWLLHRRGFKTLDVLYADPRAYFDGAKTPFSKGAVTDVRLVRGFEGVHRLNPAGQDLLVIGCGYDDELIRRVAEDKRSARKLQLYGLPSLQPHMYEENRLRAAKAEEAMGPEMRDTLLFAPAHDPFATAQELHERIAGEIGEGRNVYLSPLGTKAQALGFALFYCVECIGRPVSVLFPFAEFYSRETSVGLARVHLYRLELDWFADGAGTA